MDYISVLKQEYKQAGKTPVYCDLGKENIIIPLSYGGDKYRFIDDIFKYYAEADKYTKHNDKCSPEDILDCKMLSSGEVKFLPPFDLIKKNCSSRQIIKKSVSRALRYYHSSIKKTIRARKEYEDLEFLSSMDPEYIADLDKKHRQHCAKSILRKLGKTIKFSAEQITQMTAGAIGVIPVIAYRLLDKKFHFADTKVKRGIDKKVIPYICKGALKDLIPLSLLGAGKITLGANKDSGILKNKIEAVKNPTVEEKSIFDRKYTIADSASFADLYNASKNFMALSMFPTEVLVNEAYSDNGKKVNTVGLGSYWYPKNGDPQSPTWIYTSEYVKCHGKIDVDGETAFALMDGWFRSREGGRVYKDMCNRLTGCSLTINEFVAIATVMYNSEKNGRELCDFVRDNYDNPKQCALKIMQLKPGSSVFDEGIKKRHAHEALIYLNLDDYAEKIPYLQVKKGINSKDQTYYVTSVTQLNICDCEVMEQGLKAGSLKEAQNLLTSICSYRCKNGKAIYEIAEKNGLGYLCGMETCNINFAEVSKLKSSEDEYKTAMESYQNKEYDKALAIFKNMLANGNDGADIHNDMAITYYNMGQYDDCIRECQAVLRTGETEMYPAANYNAGKAYEKLGNYQKAKQNYNLASQRAPDEQTYQNAVKRITKSISVMSKNTGR